MSRYSTREFLAAINRYNICTWYVLPWLGLNHTHFGKDNFINSFCVSGLMTIAVQVRSLGLCQQLKEHHKFESTVRKEGKCYITFTLPEAWEDDFKLFLKGKYSKFSPNAKETIKHLSGLRNNTKDPNGEPTTDVILLALDKHLALVAKWREVLGDDIKLPEELLSIPGRHCFILQEELM